MVQIGEAFKNIFPRKPDVQKQPSTLSEAKKRRVSLAVKATILLGAICFATGACGGSSRPTVEGNGISPTPTPGLVEPLKTPEAGIVDIEAHKNEIIPKGLSYLRDTLNDAYTGLLAHGLANTTADGKGFTLDPTFSFSVNMTMEKNGTIRPLRYQNQKSGGEYEFIYFLGGRDKDIPGYIIRDSINPTDPLSVVKLYTRGSDIVGLDENQKEIIKIPNGTKGITDQSTVLLFNGNQLTPENLSNIRITAGTGNEQTANSNTGKVQGLASLGLTQEVINKLDPTPKPPEPTPTVEPTPVVTIELGKTTENWLNGTTKLNDYELLKDDGTTLPLGINAENYNPNDYIAGRFQGIYLGYREVNGIPVVRAGFETKTHERYFIDFTTLTNENGLFVLEKFNTGSVSHLSGSSTSIIATTVSETENLLKNIKIGKPIYLSLTFHGERVETPKIPEAKKLLIPQEPNAIQFAKDINKLTMTSSTVESINNPFFINSMSDQILKNLPVDENGIITYPAAYNIAQAPY